MILLFSVLIEIKKERKIQNSVNILESCWVYANTEYSV